MRFTVASALAVILPLAAAGPVQKVGEPVASGEGPALVSRQNPATDKANSLAAHNAARAAVNVPNLIWDTGLEASAQAYANTLAKTPGGVLVHSGAGENLYWQSAWTDHDLLIATQAWVNEKPNYHNETIPNGNFNAYGHYTQVVWSTTQRVGVAATRDSKGGVYVVAHYDPVGNWVGQRPY